MIHRGKSKVKWIRYQKRKSQKNFDRRRKVSKKRRRIIALTQEERRIANINEKKYSQEERKAERDLKIKYKLANKYKVVKAPKLFSFLRNTIEVLEFIEKLEKNIDLKKSTFVDLQNVDEIDHDAIVVLRSIMARFESKKITFNGNAPDDNNAKNILIESGFFESLSHNNKAITKDLIKKGSIHTHKDLRVNSELADFLIEKASKTVWNKEMRCPKIFRMFIELMGNTHEHASRGRQGEKYWYMCVHHLKNENKVIFAFVDYGMGILKSIQQKQPHDKGFEYFRSLWYKIRWNSPTSDADFFRNVLESTKRSSPDKPFRGHGLPSMHKAHQNGDIKNLHFITNNVIVSIKNGSYSQIHKNFLGTFVYWELDTSYKNLPVV